MIDLTKLSVSNLDELVCAARSRASSSSYPMSDPEYGSAVNYGVYKACTIYKPKKLPFEYDGEVESLRPFCILCALRECKHAQQQMAGWRRQDEAGACRGSEVSVMVTDPMIIPLDDFEILSFVAAHGRMRSAKMLMVSPQVLRQILDEIVLRGTGKYPWEL